MSLRQKYLDILAGIVPAGAVSVSVMLGSAAPAAASEHPASSQPSAADEAGVGERLAAIREAVSAVIGTDLAEPAAGDNLKLAWGNWWRNGGWGWRRPGWGWPNWNNWRNWNNWPNWWRNW
jgi:hypothetical protein